MGFITGTVVIWILTEWDKADSSHYSVPPPTLFMVASAFTTFRHCFESKCPAHGNMNVRNITSSMDNIHGDIIDLLWYLDDYFPLGEAKTSTKPSYISIQISRRFLVLMYRHGADHHNNSFDRIHTGIMLRSSLFRRTVAEFAFGFDAMLPTLPANTIVSREIRSIQIMVTQTGCL